MSILWRTEMEKINYKLTKMLKQYKDCKEIPENSIVTSYRIVVIDMKKVDNGKYIKGKSAYVRMIQKIR